ncbi:MAG TPA: TonB-dependent receptor, partial [bacterium]|nr:TonB-dependent receptor [bacterium]
VTTQGIEVNIISQLMDNLTGKLGYTYLDTEDEKTGKELTNRPKHKLDLELNWRIAEFGLNLNLSGQYVGRRYEDKENTIRLGGYTVLDFALTKDITKYGEIFFRLDNITGKKHVPDEYDIDGIEFLGGVKINF